MPFFNILRLQGDQHCACPQKWRHFSFFSKSFRTKKIKALRPTMSKIASRGSCLKSPVSRTASFRKKLVKKPTQAHRLEKSHSNTEKRIFDALQHFNETELQVMHDLIKCYGLDIDKSRHLILDALPWELRNVLHNYALAVRKFVK